MSRERRKQSPSPTVDLSPPLARSQAQSPIEEDGCFVESMGEMVWRCDAAAAGGIASPLRADSPTNLAHALAALKSAAADDDDKRTVHRPWKVMTMTGSESDDDAHSVHGAGACLADALTASGQTSPLTGTRTPTTLWSYDDPETKLTDISRQVAIVSRVSRYVADAGSDTEFDDDCLECAAAAANRATPSLYDDHSDATRSTAVTTAAGNDQKQIKTTVENPQPQPQPVIYKDLYPSTSDSTAATAAGPAAADKADRPAADSKKATAGFVPVAVPKPSKNTGRQQRLNKIRERLKHLNLAPARPAAVIDASKMAAMPAQMGAAAAANPKRAGIMGFMAIKIGAEMRRNAAGHREVAVKHEMIGPHGSMHFGKMVADSVGNLQIQRGYARRIPQRNNAGGATGSGAAGSGAGRRRNILDDLAALRTAGTHRLFQRVKTKLKSAAAPDSNPLYDKTTTKQF